MEWRGNRPSTKMPATLRFPLALHHSQGEIMKAAHVSLSLVAGVLLFHSTARAVPTISGPTDICVRGGASFTASFDAPVTTVHWSLSGPSTFPIVSFSADLPPGTPLTIPDLKTVPYGPSFTFSNCLVVGDYVLTAASGSAIASTTLHAKVEPCPSLSIRVHTPFSGHVFVSLESGGTRSTFGFFPRRSALFDKQVLQPLMGRVVDDTYTSWLAGLRIPLTIGEFNSRVAQAYSDSRAATLPFRALNQNCIRYAYDFAHVVAPYLESNWFSKTGIWYPKRLFEELSSHPAGTCVDDGMIESPSTPLAAATSASIDRKFSLIPTEIVHAAVEDPASITAQIGVPIFEKDTTISTSFSAPLYFTLVRAGSPDTAVAGVLSSFAETDGVALASCNEFLPGQFVCGGGWLDAMLANEHTMHAVLYSGTGITHWTVHLNPGATSNGIELYPAGTVPVSIENGPFTTAQFAGVAPAPRPRAPSLALRIVPQPARQECSIDLEGPSSGLVRVAIVDVAGRRIADWPSVRLSAQGRTRLTWDAMVDGHPAKPGLYFAIVTAGAERSGTRIVLIDY